jgi:hypothetical protein
MKKIKTLSIKQQENRILKWFNLATPTEVLEGLRWYKEAYLWGACKSLS